MWGRRICYLAVLLDCFVFHIAYGEWLSWIMLCLVLGVPWLSLLLSLPAIVSFRMEIQGPELLEMGQEADLWLQGSSRFPLPPFRGTLMLRQSLEEAPVWRHTAQGLPAEHCGGLTVMVRKPRVCDYLGLFAFPARHPAEKRIRIRPRPVSIAAPPDPDRCVPRSWYPKPGGGFAENHELRLYRPGDGLNQIHWKLSAKTGKLTIREPMLPRLGLVLLTLTLSGDRQALDRKLGRLLWMGRFLLDREIGFEIRALTAQGVLSLPVRDEDRLWEAVDRLLFAGLAPSGSIRDHAYAASWQYHIGGQADETP